LKKTGKPSKLNSPSPEKLSNHQFESPQIFSAQCLLAFDPSQGKVPRGSNQIDWLKVEYFPMH
jgi:hypothetical protein